MTIETQIRLCSYHYQKWKKMALEAKNLEDAKRFFEKAFFWLELQACYIALWSVEKTASNPKIKEKILDAKLRLSKKLAEYANKVLKELS